MSLLSVYGDTVIFRATHWLRFWAQLQRRDEDGEFLKVACRKPDSNQRMFAYHPCRVVPSGREECLTTTYEPG
ncbi:Os10g0352500 [Oryza sativa Japonica Group]|uniref:Os10g0352500 protein n=1 Tax=Oryza sativa subsp. japonica TaxID=39947 RepID=C7J7M3_ORYSJ|nr:Os10g0352500 [Oryza sativa Japonica Group]|eukprot:NP_001176101.1 Os10g0352500 [Oryza sativa Japonica Group]